MYFTSVSFLVFFVTVWLCWRFAGGWRRQLLLVASLLFLISFSWTAATICMIMALLNFGMAHLVQTRAVYIGMQSMNVLSIPLAAWAAGSSVFFDPSFGVSGVWIAAGLSFYNLQHFAYLSDVKHGRIAPETNAVSYLLISAFFPKVLSGPITLYQQMKPQIDQLPRATMKVIPGLNRILLGYFKKLVLADGLGPSVNSVFDYNDVLPGAAILAAAFLFTLQLYFDFSGYCDMAIGFGRLLGIDLPENFNFPFMARTISDFWRRWHMTLLGFFNQYVFQPFTFFMRRLREHAAALGIIVVFLLSAVWHGLGLTFLFWGISHAAYMLAEYYFLRHRRWQLPAWIGPVIVVSLFSFSNIFFRAPDFTACRFKLDQLFGGIFLPAEWDAEFLAPLAVGGHQADLFNFCAVLLLSGLFLLLEKRIFDLLEQDRFRVALSYAFLLLIFVFGVLGDAQRFIYMQF